MDETDPEDILARTVWGEARGEGNIGMTAIACVVLNRVAHPSWEGNDILSVCLKPWQFSCWNKGDPNRDKLISVTSDDPQFAIASEIASMAFSGGLSDITNGATNYYDRRMPEPPDWSAGKDPCAVIGHHLFFIVP